MSRYARNGFHSHRLMNTGEFPVNFYPQGMRLPFRPPPFYFYPQGMRLPFRPPPLNLFSQGPRQPLRPPPLYCFPSGPPQGLWRPLGPPPRRLKGWTAPPDGRLGGPPTGPLGARPTGQVGAPRAGLLGGPTGRNFAGSHPQGLRQPFGNFNREYSKDFGYGFSSTNFKRNSDQLECRPLFQNSRNGFGISPKVNQGALGFRDKGVSYTNTWPSNDWVRKEKKGRPADFYNSNKNAVPAVSPDSESSRTKNADKIEAIKTVATDSNPKSVEISEPKRVNSKNAARNTNQGTQQNSKRNFLPEPLFKIAKTMCSVLKSTHHISQVEGGKIPRQISNQAKILKSFPKPFAPNDVIKSQINDVADLWSKNLCGRMENHYLNTRNADLIKLETSSDVTEEQWQNCLSVAIIWTRCSFKKLPDNELKDGLALVSMARNKNLNAPSCSPTSSNSLEIVQEVLPIVSQSNVGPIPPEKVVLISKEKTNACLSQNVSKKDWKVPENMEHKKLLITDENFVGPVSNDFFHLTLPKCAVWDLYNVIRNSCLKPDLSLVLIHLGYKTNKDHNINLFRSIVEKIKTSCPNVKVFITSLVSKLMDKNVSFFNHFCKENYADLFLDCDLREVNFDTIQDKSEKLFLAWNNAVTALN